VSAWSDWAQEQLDGIRSARRWRSTVAFDGAGVKGRVGDREVISFASNDYLGLASHERVCAAARDAIDQWGSGSGASRLITGTRSLHHELEAALAHWKHAQRALLFSTGYAANLGALQVFGAEDATIFSDELNHASLIDGCRLAKARTLIYRHNDMAHLSELLASTPGRKIVATESVFSMDGDAAPVKELAALCAAHAALLIIDEAHAVLGPDVPASIDGFECLRVGTLSKTLGALGGWAAGSAALIDLLVNRARTFIFTTAPTPADVGAALASLAIYRSEEGTALRSRLRSLVERLRPGHPSAIVPIILGNESTALAAAQRLLDRGLYVPAIRPPTVPVGTARLRVALSAAHTDAMVNELQEALASLHV
jgi:8-amino-7-oxononanoate synthase